MRRLPASSGPGRQGLAALDERILEELLYERVRVAIDLCELLSLHADLSASVKRALRHCMGLSEEAKLDLARRYVERAWRRVGEDVVRELALADQDELETGYPSRDGRSGGPPEA